MRAYEGPAPQGDRARGDDAAAEPNATTAAIVDQTADVPRLTGCPCGCVPGEPCITDKPAPEAPGCNCGQLDAGDRKRTAELGIWCVDGCAYQRLQTAGTDPGGGRR